MDLSSIWFIIPVAFILDYGLGDPESFPHPIRWMGHAIAAAEPLFRKFPVSPFFAGILFALFLINAAWGITLLVVKTADSIHPLLRTVVEIIILFYAISARSLQKSALSVFKALTDNNLETARQRVAHLVGRDTDHLTQKGVSQAAIESLAENLVDGVISPLFFAVLGGAPLAMAYKMVNTLDSMVGYKNRTYRDFGKASARIDDAANFIPARLSVLIVAAAAQFLFRTGSLAFRTARREGTHHKSPNAGFPEAAFAGALAVKLNGPNYYQGRLVNKPYIGVDFGDPQPAHIKNACALMLLSAFLWTGVLTALTFCF